MGTPFIIIIFAIIFVCIAIAIIVVALMRKNDGLRDEETEQNSALLAPVDNLEFHTATGPLLPFLPLPHQTQPLSEIYYYNEPISAPQSSAPLALSDLSHSPTQSTPSEASPPHMPPLTGPLPGYYPNQ